MNVKDVTKGDMYGGSITEFDLFEFASAKLVRSPSKYSTSSPLLWIAKALQLGGDTHSIALTFQHHNAKQKSAEGAVASGTGSFVPTGEWQDIKGRAIPAGLDIKVDIQTGETKARLKPSTVRGEKGGHADAMSQEKPEVEMPVKEPQLLHPLGISRDLADTHTQQLRKFLSSKARTMNIDVSFVVLPRLLSILMIIGTLFLWNPDGTVKCLVYVYMKILKPFILLVKQWLYTDKKVKTPTRKPAFVWSETKSAAFEEATQTYPKGTPNRWEAVALIVGCTALDAESRARDTRAEENRVAEEKANHTRVLHEAEAAAAHAERERVERAAAKKAAKEAKARAEVEAKKKAKVVAEAEAVLEVESWTDKEQKQLERGLKLYPAEDPRRWERIADFVSTRTTQECTARYKAIVKAIKARKAKAH